MKQLDLGVGNTLVVAAPTSLPSSGELRPRFPANACQMRLSAAVFIFRRQSTADTFVQLSELTASGFMASRRSERRSSNVCSPRRAKRSEMRVEVVDKSACETTSLA